MLSSLIDMADPFSIFSGALSVADICIRVGKYLKRVKRNSDHVAEEITILEAEIATFHNTYQALAVLCANGAAQLQHETAAAARSNKDPRSALWERATELVEEGRSLVERLREVLEEILGQESPTKFQKIKDVRTAIRISSRTEEYDRLRGRFTKLNLELSMMLTAIDL